MTTPTTATSTQSVIDGKAVLVITTVMTNPDTSTTETVTTSAPQTRAQVAAIQTQAEAQITQAQGQVNVLTAKLSAATSALADTNLV